MTRKTAGNATIRPITDEVIEAVLEDFVIEGRRISDKQGAGAGALVRSGGSWGLCTETHTGDERALLSRFLGYVKVPGEHFDSEDHFYVSFYELAGGIVIRKDARVAMPSSGPIALAKIVEYLASPNDLRYRTIAALAEMLAGVRRQRRLTQDGLGELMGRGRITISMWEGGRRQLPSPGQLMQWLGTLGLVVPPSGAVVTSIDITDQFLSILREDPERLRNLNPEEFEKFTANRLDRMGFSVTRTGRTNRKDGGIDIIATPRILTPVPYLLAVQVKHHETGRAVGRPDVDRLLAWKDRQFHLGMLVTNSRFTEDARWLAIQDGNERFLRLRDFDDIKRWLEENFASEMDWREIPKHIELAPHVIIEVPRPRLVV